MQNAMYKWKIYYTSRVLLWTCIKWLCIYQHVLLIPHVVESAAVMSVDLGSEWVKVGVVSPGVPMEIALNRESQRKTPATLAFRNGVRAFGDEALIMGTRDPLSAYSYILDLLGKTIDNPIVDLYKKRFPYYDIVGDAERNTVIFRTSEGIQFSVEELIAQILIKARQCAEEYTHQIINEAVITVPGYFTNAERSALLVAAQLAELKVSQLINDYTAVALNYGIFHPSGINDTAQYYIFYDMGASHTSAALVSYQVVKDKNTKTSNPVVQVLGVGYDRSLGGLEIQLRLRDYLANEFNALKKTTTNVYKSPRALSKLFKEAARLKNVLSANVDHYAQIENLLEDVDFKLHVTRDKLEEICSDIWPRVLKPLEQALSTSGLSLNEVSQVIIFGGGTRVPKIQEMIKGYIKRDLGKSLNADEAAAIGAVYKAADLAKGFKVKKFIVKDAVLFPIQVSFERRTSDVGEAKQVKRALFGLMNPYPQKKVITFNKHTNDFEFYVHYSELNHLSIEEQSYLGSTYLLRVELQNIKELLDKVSNDSVEIKGIKAFFSIDDSGVFYCTGIELVYDKRKVDSFKGVESTLSKLSNTISKLFSKDKQDDAEGIPSGIQGEKYNVGEISKQESNGTGNQTEQTMDDVKSDNKTNIPITRNEQANQNETVKIVSIKEPIDYKLTVQFTPPLNGKAFEQSLEKLNAIAKAEILRNRLESSFNALESHIIDIQQKLEEEEYASCATEDEKQKILKECSRIAEWLYEDTEKNDTPDLYDQKLRELKQLTDVFMARYWEHEERPEALKAMANLIEGAQKFYENIQNLTKGSNVEKDVFTQTEIETLRSIINETIEWQKTEMEAQNNLNRFDDVRLTVKHITEKMAALDREVKYLVHKIKIWKPKISPNKQETKIDNDKDTEANEDKVKNANSEQQTEEERTSDDLTPEEDLSTSHTEL